MVRLIAVEVKRTMRRRDFIYDHSLYERRWPPLGSPGVFRHLWSLLECGCGRVYLFVSVQGYKVSTKGERGSWNT